MPLKQLRRIRWAVRSTLVLGVAASVVANVLHARDNPISQAIAAWPPLALLLTVELISRVPVHRRSLAAARLFATATIAGIAAWVSYWHMVGVAARYGETGASPYLLPLSVDGLIVVASICLVELGSRIAVETAAATPHTAAATTPARTGDPVRTSSLKGTSGPSGIAATTGSPGSNGTATGSPGANDIPSTAGSPSTALLPGTAGISGTANGHVPPDPVIAGPGRPTATTFRTGAGARVPVDGDPDRLGRAALRTDPDGQVAADGTGRGQPVNGMAPLFRAPPVEETTPATGDADPDVVPGRSSEDDGRTSAYGETTAEPHIAAARGEHLDGDHVNAVLDRPTRVNGTRAIPAQSRTPDGASGRVLASAVLDEVAAHLKAARPADGPAPVAARATRTTAARQRTTGSLLTSAARRTGTTPGINGGTNGTESTHSGPDTDPATAGNGRTTETATGPGNGTGTELGNRPAGPPDPAERLAGQPGAATARRPRRSAAETAALADQIQADHPDATDEEVAAHLGITPRRLRDVRRDARQLT